MFKPATEDVVRILEDFSVDGDLVSFSELQRYDYEKEDPLSKEVRLIIRADLSKGGSVVVRFKNENDVTLELIERQSEFARMLSDHGIETPFLYQAEGRYAKWYEIDGYRVIVRVEDFVPGEIQCVTADIAEKTGELLARMHNIAEETDFHVDNPVLFDPLTENDLFDYDGFIKKIDLVKERNIRVIEEIASLYDIFMAKIRMLSGEPRFAVQGDISDCNLYITADGTIGVFDFNRCGDNNLFFDAVMQALFEARLMDYPEEYEGHTEERILPAFLRGYDRIRPFTERQKEVFPYLYAVATAFWR